MLSSVASIHQLGVEQAVQKAFPNANILVNTRKEFKNSVTGTCFEVDIWLPDLLLGFEYQDAYHYATTWYTNKNLAVIKSIDTSKTEELIRSGVTLVHVPCWWDSNPESLMATINFQRPDLLPEASESQPISFNPTEDFNFLAYVVPGVGEVMLATFIVQPSKFAVAITASQPWWVGEKYDGIRCIWNPNTKELYSRRGKLLELEYPILDSLQSFIDGEVWNGRGRYAETQDIALADIAHWENMRIVTFDDPTLSSAHLPFESRYENLLTLVDASHPFLIVVSRFLCNNLTRLENLLQVILTHGGEGLIIRRPKSGYEQGRSTNLVKLKTAQADTEALVTAVANKTVTVQMPNSTKFELAKPTNLGRLKIGDVVTIDYEVYTRRAPTAPTILRIRTDVSWEEVVREHSHHIRKNAPQTVMGFSTKPVRYWTAERGKNLRMVLENYARSKKLDPLLAATWYNIPRLELVENNIVGANVVSQAGGYPKMIATLFPSIHFDETKFMLFPVGFWTNVDNRKKFLEDFAKKNRFDPLIAENWYKIRTKQFRAMKGSGLLNHYDHIFHRAILHLYPNIGLDPEKFVARGTSFKVDQRIWKDFKNQKAFFDDYAKRYKFDPLVAKNWYRGGDKLNFQEGASSFRSYLNGVSLRKYLLTVYPDIGLDLSAFPKPSRYWKSAANCRIFFNEYAKNNGFDPLIAANWYTVTSTDIQDTKVGKRILLYHDFRIKKALLWVYPDIGLDANLFQFRRHQWEDERKRRAFFDTFARSREFDPLVAENWYSFGSNDIPNIRYVIYYTDGNYSKALAGAYPEVTFDKAKFHWSQDPFSSTWKNRVYRKSFFDKFAKSQGFDPLVAKNWYNVTLSQIKQQKHSSSAMSYYGDKLTAAVADVYPDIGLDPKLFVGYKRMRPYQKEHNENNQHT